MIALFVIAGAAAAALAGIVVDASRNKAMYAAEKQRRIEHFGKNWQ